MARQYDNTNSGALFKNDKKGNEKRPDYRGTLNVGGTEYWISGWMRDSKAGAKYMQLAVQAKGAEGAPQKKAQKTEDDWAAEAENLPF